MELCCKCPKIARPGGRYCNDCHAAAQKEYRERQKTLQHGHAKSLQELLMEKKQGKRST